MSTKVYCAWCRDHQELLVYSPLAPSSHPTVLESATLPPTERHRSSEGEPEISSQSSTGLASSKHWTVQQTKQAMWFHKLLGQ